MTEVQDPLVSLSKASRRFAISSFAGVVIVCGALLYASLKLSSLENTAGDLQKKIDTQLKTEADLKTRLSGLNAEIAAKTELSQKLSAAISTSNDRQLQRRAEDIQLSPLAGVKVGVYYLAGNASAARRAGELQSLLTPPRFRGTAVQLYARPRSFFEDAALPNADEIRYEPGFETVQAQALQRLLANADSGHKYDLREVGTRTPDFISIFLHDGF
jgi:hypothetical protein